LTLKFIEEFAYFSVKKEFFSGLLAAESPCRGAGSSLFVTGVDIDGDPWANPPSIGCDEYYSGSATGLMSVAFQTSYTNVPAGFVVSFVAQISGHATASRWEFGDGTVISNEPYCSHLWAMSGNYPVSLRAYNDDYPAGLTATTLVSVLDHPVQYVALTSTNPVTPCLTWATAASNIQDAVDVGYINGTILVSNGVYSTGGRLILGSATNRVAVTLPMTVQSVNGPGVTTIQGYQVPGTTNGNGAVSCVYLSGGANLVGFTLTKGASQGAGGGVWCSSTGSIVSNCILIGNSAYTGGGGAFRGTLVNCSIVGNSVTAPGHYPGAGQGGPYGGGASGSTLNNCILVGNLGFLGGGAGGGSLNNCMILSNSAAQGGGTYASSLNNCTILNNSATNSGGGAYNGTLNNCIVYFNTSSNGVNYFPAQPGGGLNLNYCCTAPQPAKGIGNVTNDPTFVNPAGGDYHLQSNSPCINSGNNAYVTSATDLDGNPRIVGGTVDIGAYEYQTPVSKISYAWLQQYGLPITTNIDTADLDGTGMNVYQDWVAGLNPTNPASVLVMLTPVPTNNPAGLIVIWQSVSGITYFLQSSSNLGAQPAFSTIQSNIPGLAGTMSYLDTNAVGSGPYFYRVGVQQ
jgi:PKD repeat protein